jgi:hypothetical protein
LAGEQFHIGAGADLLDYIKERWWLLRVSTTRPRPPIAVYPVPKNRRRRFHIGPLDASQGRENLLQSAPVPLVRECVVVLPAVDNPGRLTAPH